MIDKGQQQSGKGTKKIKTDRSVGKNQKTKVVKLQKSEEKPNEALSEGNTAIVGKPWSEIQVELRD